jgi:hypothetical protein
MNFKKLKRIICLFKNHDYETIREYEVYDDDGFSQTNHDVICRRCSYENGFMGTPIYMGKRTDI